jgi:hypothetical protein
MTGMSVTTIGHAETGRVWQSRRFWERADKAVSAGGVLLALHDAYRTAVIPADHSTSAESIETDTIGAAEVPLAIGVAAAGLVTCVTITWAGGAVTTVYAPDSRQPQGTD